MVVLGSSIGSKEFIHAFLEVSVAKHRRLHDALLSLPAQEAYLILRYCMAPRMNHLARTVHPRLLQPHAERFDDEVMDSLTTLGALPPSLPDLFRRLFQLPIRLGGLGLRSAQLVSLYAY